jgi:hypothetical protein
VPRGEPEIIQITDGYVKERFSGRHLGSDELKALQAAWQRLRRILMGTFVERILLWATRQTGAQER